MIAWVSGLDPEVVIRHAPSLLAPHNEHLSILIIGPFLALLKKKILKEGGGI